MRNRFLIGFVSLVFAAVLAASVFAQAPAAKQEPRNPFASDAKTIKQGALLYRQECIYCHGPGARGGARGPDLTTGAWTHGGSDGALLKTISTGVPGTAMPPNHLLDDEIWQIITYLRSLQHPEPATISGDVTHGRELFFGGANCSLCHMVGGRGGRLGPELTRVGAARSRAYLIESIREPDRQLTIRNYDPESLGSNVQPYDTVTAATRDGKTVTGIAVSEDTFTVQIMDTHEKIHSFEKKSLKSFKHERKSLMPAYKEDTLSEKDLEDLVAYLETLRK